MAIRAPNASKGPDIVPYDVIATEHLRAESPYPWRDQMPPPRYMLKSPRLVDWLRQVTELAAARAKPFAMTRLVSHLPFA